jgi:hypothetical protein
MPPADNSNKMINFPVKAMTKSMKSNYLCLLAVFLFACNPINTERLKGVWKISKVEDPRITEIGEGLDENFPATMDNIMDQQFRNSYINFYSSSDFTGIMGTVLIYGTWTYDETAKRITLHEQRDRRALTFNVKEFTGDKLVLTMNEMEKLPTSTTDSLESELKLPGLSQYFNDAGIVMECDKDTYDYKQPKDNIYSLENNRWRNKPKQHETPSQVKARLKQNMKFIMAYLNNTLAREEKSIHLGAIRSPIEFASNGIQLQDENSLPQEWVDIFYDRAQALEAHALLRQGFRSDIRAKNIENWIELDLDLLKQLYDKI